MGIIKIIRQLVTEDIFKIWDTKGVEYAKIELQKLYFKSYNELKDIEDKRLILWNLIVACRELGDMESVKIYTEQLKKDMDNTPKYKTTDKNWYARMLTAYRDSHENELTKDELIKINMFCYNAYRKYTNPDDGNYMNMLVTKFNLTLSLKQYDMVFEVIRIVLHTNKKQHDNILYQMIEDVRKEDINLYKQVQLLIESQKLEVI